MTEYIGGFVALALVAAFARFIWNRWQDAERARAERQANPPRYPSPPRDPQRDVEP